MDLEGSLAPSLQPPANPAGEEGEEEEEEEGGDEGEPLMPLMDEEAVALAFDEEAQPFGLLDEDGGQDWEGMEGLGGLDFEEDEEEERAD